MFEERTRLFIGFLTMFKSIEVSTASRLNVKVTFPDLTALILFRAST